MDDGCRMCAWVGGWCTHNGWLDAGSIDSGADGQTMEGGG